MIEQTAMSDEQKKRLDAMQDMAKGICTEAVDNLAALLLIATELRDISITLRWINDSLPSGR